MPTLLFTHTTVSKPWLVHQPYVFCHILTHCVHIRAPLLIMLLVTRTIFPNNSTFLVHLFLMYLFTTLASVAFPTRFCALLSTELLSGVFLNHTHRFPGISCPATHPARAFCLSCLFVISHLLPALLSSSESPNKSPESTSFDFEALKQDLMRSYSKYSHSTAA